VSALSAPIDFAAPYAGLALIRLGRVTEDTTAVCELADIRRLWFVNSLRGWIEVRLA
jgi:hypothetical protein